MLRLARRGASFTGVLRTQTSSSTTPLACTAVQSRCFAAAAEVRVTFIEDGKEKECSAPAGTTLLDLAWDNDIDLEGTNHACPL